MQCAQSMVVDFGVAFRAEIAPEFLDTSGLAEENDGVGPGGGMERTARCHCGQLRAVASGEPDSVYVCHCRACQRRTGAVVHNGSRWPKERVRIEGEHKVYERGADSGFNIRFHFCPNCGTSVFWEGDRSPATCGIAIGCFADPDFPAPTQSGWEEAMHQWLGLPPGIAHFPQSRS